MFKSLIKPFGSGAKRSYTDICLLLLRVTFGFFMLYGHGLSKLQKFTRGGDIQFPNFLWFGTKTSLKLAIFAEVFCAFLLIFGAFTRLATIPLIITMLVAIFMIHLHDPLTDKEGAILYLVPYIVLLIKGGGKYSVDARLLKLKL